MRPLGDILKGIPVKRLVGDSDRIVGEPSIDSRTVGSEGVFIAIRGTQTDGHKFIEKAIQNGAKTVVCQDFPDEMTQGITWVSVDNSSRAAGIIAHNYFDRPTDHLKIIGVTGTNGKTTVATLLYSLLQDLGKTCGLLSTVENRIGNKVLGASHTTPDPISLNRFLSDMVNSGCEYACMEVSSHAIDQERISGLTFTGGIFTNISHDHLDYHGTFRHYLDTKKRFFDDLGAQAFALVNADDPRGDYMVQNTKAKVSKYSLRKLTDFKAKIIGNDLSGLHLRINDNEVMSRLIGEFNAYNLLAVYGAAVLLGNDKHEVLTTLSGLLPAEGRFDVIRGRTKKISAIVDYAHTPDALQKVLGTLVKVKDLQSRIWVVVGCGGDRDRTKRPMMAKIAATYADRAIFTSDNPRSEDPEEILGEMMTGIPEDRKSSVLKITDRREAIRAAVQMAGEGDVILIAGKGHEKYQEIKGKRFDFDDKEVVQNALQENI